MQLATVQALSAALTRLVFISLDHCFCPRCAPPYHMSTSLHRDMTYLKCAQCHLTGQVIACVLDEIVYCSRERVHPCAAIYAEPSLMSSSRRFAASVRWRACGK